MSGWACSLSLCLTALAAALGGAPAAAVTVDWVGVGGPGNLCDAQPQGCFGAVAAAFSVARTEVTNAQYAEFLNAVAKADPNALYNTAMASSGAGHGGITRSGSPGDYAYSAVAGRENLPVNYVSFYDALRFANWLHNGQPWGHRARERPRRAPTRLPSRGSRTTRSRATRRPASRSRARTSGTRRPTTTPPARATSTTRRAPTPRPRARRPARPRIPRTAAAPAVPRASAILTAVGSYTGAASPNGTLDQGGNVWEWNEAIVDGTSRGLRGGSFNVNKSNLAASSRSNTVPDAESSIMGFRVVSLPEPGGSVVVRRAEPGRCWLKHRASRSERKSRAASRRRAKTSSGRAKAIRIAAAVLLALPASLPAAADPDPSLISEGHRGGSFTWDYCEGKPDATPLPPDPRTLVQPGTNAGKAVHVNTYWKNCHVDPEAVEEVGAAETCGELRQRFYRGELLLDTGSPGAAGLFTGTERELEREQLDVHRRQFNQVWQVWGGYVERPANFDELVAERYGSAFGPSPNPYPLPGEDPNQTNGGSGTLPELFTQLRNGQYGDWSGEITVTCHGCHSGGVGRGSRRRVRAWPAAAAAASPT